MLKKLLFVFSLMFIIISFNNIALADDIIQNINVTDITHNSVAINFQVDIPVKCSVLSNIAGAPASDLSIVSENSFTANNHKVILRNLEPVTKYDYSIICQDQQGQLHETATLNPSGLDPLGNPLLNFTTIPSPDIEEVIQNIQVTDITHNSVAINFQVDIPVKCSVLSNIAGAPTSDLSIVSENSFTANNHKVILRNLEPVTKYDYSIICQDQQGQLHETATLNPSGLDPLGNPLLNFTTMPSPDIEEVIQNINVSDITNNSAVINFYSAIPVKCRVSSNAEGAPIQNVATVHQLGFNANNHKISLQGSLTPSTKFYYSLVCQDQQGSVYQTAPLNSSGFDSLGNPILNFTTLPNPGGTIQNIQVTDITHNSAVINFYAAIPVKCIVSSNAEGAPIQNVATVHQLGFNANNHKISLQGSLTPSTKFYYSLVCQDQQGSVYETAPLNSSGFDSLGNPLLSFTTLPSPGTRENKALKNTYQIKKEVLKREMEKQVSSNSSLTNRLSGRILLQVEEKGEAWYVDPVVKAKHFMGRPDDAFSMMREFGLGISEANFKNFQEKDVPSKFAGRIFLRAEKNGEAYYVNPLNFKLHYLGRPEDAFRIMRELALGISNDNLRQIPLGAEN